MRSARSTVLALAAVVATLGAILGAAAGATAAAASGLPLCEVARVPLPGLSVRFDYTSVDPSTGLLWVAHMNAGTLLALSLRTRKIVHTVDVPGVHRVIAVPALGHVCATTTDGREALTLDACSGRVLNHAPAGRYPDGLAWDPVERHVFVSDESGGVEAVLSAKGDRIATIDRGGEASNVQYDAGSGLVLADIQTREDVAVIDPKANRVVRRIPLAGCGGSGGGSQLLVLQPAQGLRRTLRNDRPTAIFRDRIESHGRDHRPRNVRPPGHGHP